MENLSHVNFVRTSTFEYEEDPYAYKIALLYFITNGISASMSTSLSPLSKTLSTVYNAHENLIWYINTVFTIFNLFFNYPANYFIEKFGVRPSIIFGLFLTCIGGWMRTGINKKLSNAVLGQTLMAIAGPFIINCISKISNLWFTQKNRIKITSLMSSSYMFGLGFGFLLTSLCWSESSDIIIIKTEIDNLMHYSALVCTFLSIPVILYFREQPDNPPSLSAVSDREEFCVSIITLLKNKDFIYLLGTFSIGLGNFITLVLMIHHVIAPFNYTEYQISNIGLIINFSSGISKCIIAFIAGKYITLKNTMSFIFIFIFFSSLLLSFSLSSGSIILVYFTSFIFGFFCQMYWGPALEYACEIAFPVSEVNATGTLLFGGCIMGIIENFCVSLLYNDNEQKNCINYLILFYIIAIGFMYLISNRLKREEFEKNRKISQENF